jgi:hypothetical protein
MNNILIETIKNFEKLEGFQDKSSTITEEISKITKYEVNLLDKPVPNEPEKVTELREFYKNNELFMKFYQKIHGPNSVVLLSDNAPENFVQLPEYQNIAIPVEWKEFLGPQIKYAKLR